MEAEMGTSWFWDQIFSNPPQEDWDTDTHTAAVEGLGIDLDAAEWSPWDDLNIDHTNGCSVNSLSLPTDLQKIEDYLIDAELEFGDAINIEEGPILSPQGIRSVGLLIVVHHTTLNQRLYEQVDASHTRIHVLNQ